jgi:antitoxin component YwqK of YwqJK toxin-antitoxin module
MYFEGKPFNGVVVDFYSNGQLRSELPYKDGKKDGLYQRWNENGQLLREETYKDGVRIN